MVIAGAGECGARAALALRENGYEGPVTLIGEEACLPYERPPLSKQAMSAPEASPRTIVAADALAGQRIDFIAGTPAVNLDIAERTVRLGDGRAVPFERLLIATGAVPRRLAPAGSGPRVAYLRTFDDALAIRARHHARRRRRGVGTGRPLVAESR